MQLLEPIPDQIQEVQQQVLQQAYELGLLDQPPDESQLGRPTAQPILPADASERAYRISGRAQARYEWQLQADLTALYRQVQTLEAAQRAGQQLVQAELARLQQGLAALWSQAEAARSRCQQPVIADQVQRFGPTEFQQQSGPMGPGQELTGQLLGLLESARLPLGPQACGSASGLYPAILASQSVTRPAHGGPACRAQLRGRCPLGEGLAGYVFDPSLVLDDNPNTFFLDWIDLPFPIAPASLGTGSSILTAPTWPAWLPPGLVDRWGQPARTDRSASWLFELSWESSQQFNFLQVQLAASPEPVQLAAAWARVGSGAISSFLWLDATTLRLAVTGLSLADQPGQLYLVQLAGNPLEPDPADEYLRAGQASGMTILIDCAGLGEPGPADLWPGRSVQIYRQLALDGRTDQWAEMQANGQIEIHLTDGSNRVRTDQLLLTFTTSGYRPCYLGQPWDPPFGPSSANPLVSPEALVEGEPDHRTRMDRVRPFWQPADQQASKPWLLEDYLSDQARLAVKLAEQLPSLDGASPDLMASFGRAWSQLQDGLRSSPVRQVHESGRSTKGVRYQCGLAEVNLEDRYYWPVSYYLSDPFQPEVSLTRLAVTCESAVSSGSSIELWLVPRPDLGPLPLDPAAPFHAIGPRAAYQRASESERTHWLEVPLQTRTDWFEGDDQDRQRSLWLSQPIYRGLDIVHGGVRSIGARSGWLYNPNCNSFDLPEQIASPICQFEETSSTMGTLIGQLREWQVIGLACLVTVTWSGLNAQRGGPTAPVTPASIATFGWSVQMGVTDWPVPSVSCRLVLKPEYEVWPLALYFSTLLDVDMLGTSSGRRPIWRSTFCRTEQEGYILELAIESDVVAEPPSGWFYCNLYQRKVIGTQVSTRTLLSAPLAASQVMKKWVDWAVWLPKELSNLTAGPDEWIVGVFAHTNAAPNYSLLGNFTVCSVIYGSGLEFDTAVPGMLYLDYVAQWGRYQGYQPVKLTAYTETATFRPEEWGRDYRLAGPPRSVVDILRWVRPSQAMGPSQPTGGTAPEPSQKKVSQKPPAGSLSDISAKLGGRRSIPSTKPKEQDQHTVQVSPTEDYFESHYRNWLPYQGNSRSAGLVLQLRYQPEASFYSSLAIVEPAEIEGEVQMGPILEDGDFQIDFERGRVYLTESGRAKQVFLSPNGTLTYNQIQATFWVRGPLLGWRTSSLPNPLPVSYNRSELYGPGPILQATQLDPSQPGYYPALDYVVLDRKVTLAEDFTPAGPWGANNRIQVEYQTLGLQPQLLVKLECPEGAAQPPSLRWVELHWYREQ